MREARGSGGGAWGPLLGVAGLALAAQVLPEVPRILLTVALGLACVPASLFALRRKLQALEMPPGAPEPSKEERNTLRTVRALVVFDALMAGPLAAIVVHTLLEVPAHARFNPMLAVFLFALLFYFPLPVQWRRLRLLREARAQGLLPVGPARVSTTGDHALDDVLARKPYATRALLIVIGLVSVAAWLYQPLEALLWKDNQAILAGEVWRLVTVMLVHGGILHLAMNLSALSSVGSAAELLLGVRRLLFVMLAGGVAASLASVAFTPGPAVGASGGIAAVIGALLTFGWRQRDLLPPGVRDRLVRGGGTAAVMTALLGVMVQNVDNAAHAGGFAFGLVCGLLFQPSPALRQALAAARALAVASPEPPPRPPDQA
ncbi:MAG: rhomboid family intramembrane serine protease [Anaeromyxobacter sp.]